MEEVLRKGLAKRSMKRNYKDLSSWERESEGIEVKQQDNVLLRDTSGRTHVPEKGGRGSPNDGVGGIADFPPWETVMKKS